MVKRISYSKISRGSSSQAARPQIAGYGIAVLSVGAALVIKLILDPLIGRETPFLLFFGAVMASAWYGGRVTNWNKGAENIFGYEEAEANGQDAAFIFTPEDREVAYARPEDQERALAAGYQKHISKPIEPADLATAVAGVIERNGRKQEGKR